MGTWFENNWMLLVLVIISVIGVALNYYKNNKQKQQNQQDEEYLQDSGFNIDKKIDNLNNEISIFIDDKNKKWCIYNTKSMQKIIYDYEEFVSFELKQDNKSVVSGRAGSTIVGGLLFGGLGALAGASRKRNITETSCKSMTLYIVVNDMSNPNIEIPLIEREISKDSSKYEKIVNKVNELVAVFKVILEQNKKLAKEKTNSKNSTQELREYKQLLDDGIITEEEFNKKKKEILNNKE